MALALQNAGRRRINKVSRAALAILDGVINIRENPRARYNREPSRFRSTLISDSERAAGRAAVAEVLSVVAARPDKSVSKAFPRNKDVTGWYEHVTTLGPNYKPNKKTNAIRSFLKQEAARQMGIPIKRQLSQGKARRYKSKKKYETYEWAPETVLQGKFFKAGTRRRRAVPRKPVKVQSKVWYESIGGKSGYRSQYDATPFSDLNDWRVGYRKRLGLENFDPESHEYQKPYLPVGYWHGHPGPSGAILMRESAEMKALGEAGKRYKKKGRKRGKLTGEAKVTAAAKLQASTQPYRDYMAAAKADLGGEWPPGEHAAARAAWKARSRSNPYGALSLRRSRSNPYGALSLRRARRNSAEEVKAAYKLKHAIKKKVAAAEAAQENYGALALDNYGALALDNYGALALDNRGIPFLGGVAADTGKLVLTGLAGALGHALIADKVEDYLPSIPGGEMLLDLTVPEAIPLIGGMELDNTITGAITGIALIAASQFLGRRVGNPMIASYGSALGTGIILAGPILDFAAAGDDDDEEEEEVAEENYGALALDNYGALSLENEGTFGDGMAYQLGAIVQEDAGDYGQASLGDAYYSGADFDLGEGQAFVNGRQFFRSRYGHPSRRIGHMGGVRGAASHLASKPGHRWGWLIKMIGWKNVQALAAMPPAQRVATIKKLRANALDTFQQLQAEQVQVTAAAAPELVPVSSEGADGVSGAFGAYGATIFSGAGL